jgi:outer membrane protein OmpA-like peptidoglycan-associated protein
MIVVIRRPILSVLALFVCGAGVLLAWALWWPVKECADPVCARQRFSLFIELDAFKGVGGIRLHRDSQEHSELRRLLADGGIDLTLAEDQTDLPYDPSSGRLDRADLYQYASVWRSLRPPASADARVYAIVAPGLVADNGDALFGLMFDYSDREGFAVAPSETQAKFRSHNPGAIPLLQLRTFAHELLHALNRSHIDAARLPQGLTVEAPTRCLSTIEGRDWSLREQPVLELSPASILFFQTAKPADVLPGRGNTPFDLRRGAANECAEILGQPPIQRAASRWDFAVQRVQSLFSVSVAHAEDAESMVEMQASQPAAEVHVQALPTAYPLGYPIAVRLLVKNLGTEALPLRDRLQLEFGLIQIDVREQGTDEWRAVQPLAWYEPSDNEGAMLAPGEITEQTVPIYFGESGWSFPRAGAYEVRARLRLGDDRQVAYSESVVIRVEAPRSERDSIVLRALTNEDGELDPQLGRLLAFGGRIGAEQAMDPIERIIREYPDTALGSALRLTQASQELRPPIDPRTGKREPANAALAEDLLDDTCTDSGVAALRRALIEAHADLFPRLDISQEQAHEAWDGSSRRGSTFLRTYSDPTLEQSGPSLHFCFDEDELRGPVRQGARRLGRELAATKPERVMIIGHADGAASCRYNERLAQRRADAVRRVLVQSGVRSDRIVTVSLGERRPRDFAATPEAQAANRRVEILIDAPSEERRKQRFRSKPVNELVPRCPARAGTN